MKETVENNSQPDYSQKNMVEVNKAIVKTNLP